MDGKRRSVQLRRSSRELAGCRYGKSLTTMQQQELPPMPAHSETLGETAAAETRRLFRLAWLITVLLAFGIVGWAQFTHISGAVVAPGLIAVDGKRKVIQHLDGGNIS